MPAAWLTIGSAMAQRFSTCTLSPAALTRIVLLVFAGQFLVVCFAHLFFQSGQHIHTLFRLGDDYRYFNDAARQWLAGRNPYAIQDFVTPPPSVIPAALLARMSLAHARAIFEVLNVVLIAVGLWGYGRALGLVVRERIYLLLVAATFVSSWEAVQGGNLDGLMLAGLLFAFAARRTWARALFLGATIVLKIYSGVLLLVAARRRRFSLIGGAVVVAAASLLPFARWLPAMVHALTYRAGRAQWIGNISPSALFALGMNADTVAIATWLFWIATLAWALWHDGDTKFTAETLARYAPWMMAAPALVFSYTGVLALPVFAWLLLRARTQTWAYPDG